MAGSLMHLLGADSGLEPTEMETNKSPEVCSPTAQGNNSVPFQPLDEHAAQQGPEAENPAQPWPVC